MEDVLLFILPIIILWQYLRIRHWKMLFDKVVDACEKHEKTNQELMTLNAQMKMFQRASFIVMKRAIASLKHEIINLKQSKTKQ